MTDAPQAATTERVEVTVRHGEANSHVFEDQLWVGSECIAFSGEPWSSRLADALNADMPTIWEDPAGKGYLCFDRPMTPKEARAEVDDLRARLAAAQNAPTQDMDRLREAADPFARMLRLNEPLRPADDTPLHRIVPNLWPTVGDLRKLIAALASTPIAAADGGGEVEPGQWWRHVKRGTSYEVIGLAGLQMSSDLVDGSDLVVYRGEDGRLWAREEGEFTDGRFVHLAALTPTPSPAEPPREVTQEQVAKVLVSHEGWGDPLAKADAILALFQGEGR